MDLIKNIIVEMRPRLCSCSVVIITNVSLSDKSLNISIRPNHIIINYSDNQYTKKKFEPKRQKTLRRDSSSSYESYSDSEDEKFSQSQFINISSYCKLIPNSLSTLKVERNFMSFRILTEPFSSNSSGTVYNEVFNNINSNVVNAKNFCAFEKLPVVLKEKTSVKLQCLNCSNDMFDPKDNSVLSFDRVLELPSDNMDMSDWFCHKHDNHENESSERTNSLVPLRKDIFYGLGYFLVNFTNLKLRLVEFNKKRDVINCERCFSHLGMKIQETSYKLWDSCVKFVTNDESHECFHFFHKVTQTEPKNVSLENFLYVIKYAIKNSIIDSVNTTCKLILECEINKRKKSMLIWIMDKNIQILKTEPNQNPESNRNEIKLEDVFTSKLLYRCDEGSEYDIWSKDPCVQNFEVSKDMFSEGSKHLNEMSEYIPFSFRKSNDFFVTYLKI